MLQACHELSAPRRSLSRHGDDRSDSGVRQHQTLEPEATRQAVLAWYGGVKESQMTSSSSHSLPRFPNSDNVITRQDVSTACPCMQEKPRGLFAPYVSGLQSLTEGSCSFKHGQDIKLHWGTSHITQMTFYFIKKACA